MKLEGIHHVTAITADAARNASFYVGVLGLRLVKKTVNQDDPSVYHLFYADEKGSAGSDITFFEYPGAPRGRAGAGMVHRVIWRISSEESLDFWTKRLESAGVKTTRTIGSVLFSNPEGLDHELVIDQSGDEPLRGDHPEIPREFALLGFDSVRAFSSDPTSSAASLSQTLGFSSLSGDKWESRGARRGSFYFYDVTPPMSGLAGAGTVHHVAWSSMVEDHKAWHDRVSSAGLSPTPIIDRFWFRSIYFREPSGVLFEIATLGPGFTVDEPAESLGQKLVLPPAFEHMREQIESTLTPLPTTQDLRAGSVGPRGLEPRPSD